MNTSFSLVIFDHDGVLVDSESIAMRLLARLSTDMGLPMTADQAFARYLGTSFDFVVQDLRDQGAVVDRDELHRTFHEALFADFRTSLTPIPGVPDLLADLTDADVPIAIASSGSSQRVELGITSTGIDHYFAESVITTADHVSRGKPFPDLFLTTAQRAGVPARQCVVIEDSPFGVDAARRAGMKVIGLSYQTPAEKLVDADWLIDDMSQARAILLG